MRQVQIFLGLGICSTILDFSIYQALLLPPIFEVNVAKAFGCIGGMSFAYFSNMRWTFNHRSHRVASSWRFIILYTCTLGFNVLINWIALKLFSPFLLTLELPFLVATGFCAIINFFGLKLFVFSESMAKDIQNK